MKIKFLSLCILSSFFSLQPSARAAAPDAHEMLPALAASETFLDLVAATPNLHSIKMFMRPDFRMDPEVRVLCQKIAKWPSSAVAEVDIEVISAYDESSSHDPMITLTKHYFATVPTSDASGHLMVGLCDAK